MTQQIRQTVKVLEALASAIAAEGVDHVFAVMGDANQDIIVELCEKHGLKYVHAHHETSAVGMADGYARIRGAAMLATTYGVGELSAINGVMGAKAERSLVFHVVGMPSYQHQRVHKITHHTLGDGVFGNFVDLSAGAACCHAVITPDTVSYTHLDADIANRSLVTRFVILSP